MSYVSPVWDFGGQQKLRSLPVSYPSWWFWENILRIQKTRSMVFTWSDLCFRKRHRNFIISKSGFINSGWNNQKENYKSSHCRYLRKYRQTMHCNRPIRGRNLKYFLTLSALSWAIRKRLQTWTLWLTHRILFALISLSVDKKAAWFVV